MTNSSLITERERTTPTARTVDDWGDIVAIPAKLSVETPFANLTVRELSVLEKGSVLATRHGAGTPVPVLAAGVFIGWGEFQVVGEKLALRIAEIE
jgi:flagellar motor switch/type III secretory pathway protein FliN